MNTKPRISLYKVIVPFEIFGNHFQKDDVLVETRPKSGMYYIQDSQNNMQVSIEVLKNNYGENIKFYKNTTYED